MEIKSEKSLQRIVSVRTQYHHLTEEKRIRFDDALREVAEKHFIQEKTAWQMIKKIGAYKAVVIAALAMLSMGAYAQGDCNYLIPTTAVRKAGFVNYKPDNYSPKDLKRGANPYKYSLIRYLTDECQPPDTSNWSEYTVEINYHIDCNNRPLHTVRVHKMSGYIDTATASRLRRYFYVRIARMPVVQPQADELRLPVAGTIKLNFRYNTITKVSGKLFANDEDNVWYLVSNEGDDLKWHPGMDISFFRQRYDEYVKWYNSKY
jgi:hypothetical protein